MPGAELTSRLRGHRDAVCCVQAVDAEHLALTGSEDGTVGAFDLRTGKLTQRVRVAEGDATVPSLAAHPADGRRLFAAADASVSELDLRQSGEAAVLRSFTFNTEEVNCVAINAKGTLLATADDAGQAAVIDIAAGSLVRLLRKGGHANLASSAAFRPHHPWELLTGGLDSVAIRWDFSAGRPLRRWNLEEAAGDAGSSAAGSQVCNPPLVHCVATPPASAERVLGRTFAAACGDGSVAVFDADPSSAPEQRGARGAQAQPPGQPLFRDAEAHAAAANCVVFPEAGRGAVLCTGGNDGRVVLQDWTAALPQGSPYAGKAQNSLAQRVQIAHGRKVNCVAVCSGGLETVLVADVGHTISLYKLR